MIENNVPPSGMPAPYFFKVEMPPSVNECYHSGRKQDKGKYLTAEAKTWKSLAQFTLPAPRVTFQGPVRVEYEFFFNHRYVQDVANYEKMLTDALVTRGVLKDDRYIKRQDKEKFITDKAPFVCGAVIPLPAPFVDKYGTTWN